MISYSGLIGLQKMYSQRQRRNNESKNADEFYKILERKAIYPVFQPIVNLQTGDVAGYELLVVSTGMIRLL